MEYGARERSFVELREECLGVRVLESQADIPRSPKREVAADPAVRSRDRSEWLGDVLRMHVDTPRFASEFPESDNSDSAN